MPAWLLELRIDHAAVLLPLYLLTAAAAMVLAIRREPRAQCRRRLARGGLAMAAGGAIAAGVALAAAAGGVAPRPTAAAVLWAVILGSGLVLAVLSLRRAGWWRRIVAIAFAPLLAASFAAGINAEYGAYPHLGEALHYMPFPALPAELLTGHTGDSVPRPGWPPAGMPANGIIGAVDIPGVTSHFPARQAVVYLPPAARMPDPPRLPVLVLFAGQPGEPASVFTSGRAAAILDDYAAAHNGLAPIVVAPDQLGFPGRNPMCVDSPLGNAATYLTVDVPTWIQTHLPAAVGSRHWAVGGYSEGGTCASQLGAGHPELFSGFVPVLSELQPYAGPDTVAAAFDGSPARYRAAGPLALLRQHAPYPHSFAIFGTGAHDRLYTGRAKTLADASVAAGIPTRLIVAPDSGHSWTTVRYVWSRALPLLADWLAEPG